MISRLPREYILLTPEEVSKKFGVNRKTLARWARDGRLPAIKTPGGQYRFEEYVVEGLLGRPVPL